jgi:RNA polymerase sigma-B factor
MPDPPAARAALAAAPDEDLLARARHLPAGHPERAAAREELVRRYAPLVRQCARAYRASPEPPEDLIQVGYVGLLKAINNFDPGYGRGLRAYALPCITGEIKRHFRDKRWQVRVTRPVQELLLELRAATEDLTHQLGRHPADTELAERLGVTPDDLRHARQAGEGFTALSLDAPLTSHDDPADLASLLGTDDPALTRTLDMQAITRHWDELPRREQRILVLRFYGNYTQEEIAAHLGISQMHVSRLLTRALNQLKDRLTHDHPTRRQTRPTRHQTG